MKRLFIEPIDVWMFRDGRPFDAGSQHRAVSLFPPPPSVVQGALRSNHLSVVKADLIAYQKRQSTVIDDVGYGDETYGRFKMMGPFVAQEDESGRLWRYFPQPADAVKVGNVYRPAGPRDEPDVVTELPHPDLRLLWHPAGTRPEKETEPNWWREDALRDYLRHNKLSATHMGVVSQSQLIVRESRIGIDYDDAQGTSAEGMLYEAEFVRPRDHVGLDVEMTDDLLVAWPTSGVITIGGEMRAARYRTDYPPADPMPRTRHGERFKLYFATPAYFRSGWQPVNGDWTELFHAKVTCVGAAVGRALTVGGFDLAKGQHKPSCRYVPAGSVYYFDGPASLPDVITEQGAEIGFGYYFTGGWQ